MKAWVVILVVAMASAASAAEFCITIPNPQAVRARDAVCARNGYQATLESGQPNGETCNDFARRWLLTQIKSVVRETEVSNAKAEAQATIAAGVDTDIPYEPTATPDGGAWTPTPEP